MKLTWQRYWQLLLKARFRPMHFVHEVRLAALHDLTHEFESHDYFIEGRMVRSFINTEPKP